MSTDGSPIAWILLLAVEALRVPHPALAARPFITDDARVTAPHACQLETWGQIGPGGDEYWAVPACNFTGNLELSAGLALLPNADGDGARDPAAFVQGKTIFHALTTDGYGWGLGAGGVIDGTPNQDDDLGTAYAYVPATVSFLHDRLLMHANAGLRYEQNDGGVRGIWGLAGEFLAVGPLFALAEVFGTTRERPFSQFGMRLWLVPEYVQFDGTYGIEYGAPVDDTYWVSVGLRLLSPPLY